jgi:hypothetical protein
MKYVRVGRNRVQSYGPGFESQIQTPESQLDRADPPQNPSNGSLFFLSKAEGHEGRPPTGPLLAQFLIRCRFPSFALDFASKDLVLGRGEFAVKKVMNFPSIAFNLSALSGSFSEKVFLRRFVGPPGLVIEAGDSSKRRSSCRHKKLPFHTDLEGFHIYASLTR